MKWINFKDKQPKYKHIILVSMHMPAYEKNRPKFKILEPINILGNSCWKEQGNDSLFDIKTNEYFLGMCGAYTIKWLKLD
ncbi:MAG TPA: hypothetical protein VL443_06285 [Cyclobacteriaceae bacterium]|jgi:hypothetical protein|nr:hypothetical protein [Cyclobacteriaceae bacterium]